MNTAGSSHTVVLAVADAWLRHSSAVRLRRNRHYVVEAANVNEATSFATSNDIDLLVVDSALAGIETVTDAAALAQQHATVGLALDTATPDPRDDTPHDPHVLPRPVATDELVDRVNDLLRPTLADIAAPTDVISYPPLHIDPTSTTVTLADTPVQLDDKAFGVLHLLAMTPRRIFSRHDLLWAVWKASPEWQHRSVVSACVRQLCAAIQPDPDSPAWVRAEWGLGYSFDPEAHRTLSMPHGDTP